MRKEMLNVGPFANEDQDRKHSDGLPFQDLNINRMFVLDAQCMQNFGRPVFGFQIVSKIRKWHERATRS